VNAWLTVRTEDTEPTMPSREKRHGNSERTMDPSKSPSCVVNFRSGSSVAFLNSC
jgi:hypothetical protein